MNANELADEMLEFYHDPDGLPYLIGEAATMLRKQQAEIEALKERCTFLEAMAIMVHTPAFPDGLNKTLRDLLDKAPLKDKP